MSPKLDKKRVFALTPSGVYPSKTVSTSFPQFHFQLIAKRAGNTVRGVIDCLQTGPETQRFHQIRICQGEGENLAKNTDPVSYTGMRGHCYWVSVAWLFEIFCSLGVFTTSFCAFFRRKTCRILGVRVVSWNVAAFLRLLCFMHTRETTHVSCVFECPLFGIRVFNVLPLKIPSVLVKHEGQIDE